MICSHDLQELHLIGAGALNLACPFWIIMESSVYNPEKLLAIGEVNQKSLTCFCISCDLSPSWNPEVKSVYKRLFALMTAQTNDSTQICLVDRGYLQEMSDLKAVASQEKAPNHCPSIDDDSSKLPPWNTACCSQLSGNCIEESSLLANCLVLTEPWGGGIWIL